MIPNCNLSLSLSLRSKDILTMSNVSAAQICAAIAANSCSSRFFFFYMQHYLHISSLTVCLSVGKCTLLADVFFCPMALEEKRKHLRQATDIEKIALTCRQYKIVWIPNIVKKVFSDLGFGLCNYMCSIVCILTFLVHFCLLLFFFSSNQRDLTIVLFLACFSIIRIANAFNSYSIALCSVCKQLFEKQRKVVSFWTVTFAFTSPI